MDPAEDFAARAEAYRRELRVHRYRQTGSFDEAEDLVIGDSSRLVRRIPARLPAGCAAGQPCRDAPGPRHASA